MCSDGHQPPAPHGHLCIQVGMQILKKVVLLGENLLSIVLSQSSGCRVATPPLSCSLCSHCRKGCLTEDGIDRALHTPFLSSPPFTLLPIVYFSLSMDSLWGSRFPYS